MKKNWKRVLSFFTVFCLLFSLMPSAYAAGGDGEEEPQTQSGGVTVVPVDDPEWEIDKATGNALAISGGQYAPDEIVRVIVVF